MTNENISAILRELRKATNDLPAGKRNEVINKLNRVEFILKRRNIANITVPSVSDPVDESIEFERQRMTVYNWMLAGHTITSLQAIKMWGITRLSARIKDIEKMTGIAPNRRRITVQNRNGRNVSVCEYYLQQKED